MLALLFVESFCTQNEDTPKKVKKMDQKPNIYRSINQIITGFQDFKDIFDNNVFDPNDKSLFAFFRQAKDSDKPFDQLLLDFMDLPIVQDILHQFVDDDQSDLPTQMFKIFQTAFDNFISHIRDPDTEYQEPKRPKIEPIDVAYSIISKINHCLESRVNGDNSQLRHPILKRLLNIIQRGIFEEDSAQAPDNAKANNSIKKDVALDNQKEARVPIDKME